MSIMSNKSNYDMDHATAEINQKKLILDLKVETQTILQLLVSKGVVTREEVVAMRNTVRNSPNYKMLFDELNDLESKVEYYKNNPEQHLKDLLSAKIDGRIK